MPDQFSQLKETVIAGEGEAAKRLIAELLDIKINSVERLKTKMGLKGSARAGSV